MCVSDKQIFFFFYNPFIITAVVLCLATAFMSVAPVLWVARLIDQRPGTGELLLSFPPVGGREFNVHEEQVRGGWGG